MYQKSVSRIPLVVRVFVGLVFARAVLADEPPGRPTTRNVRVIAYSEVQGRPPFKMAIQERHGRWYLYMGHLWDRGWTIMDVTHPSRPSVVQFVPGPTNTWTIQMEIEDNKMITALERIPQIGRAHV